MKIKVITLFPEMFKNVLMQSIIKRAQDNNKVNIDVCDLRQWTSDKHKTVDDSPYGGGAGMILKPDIIDRALSELKQTANGQEKIILLTPQGKRFTQKIASEFSQYTSLIFICGHYGGFDERIRRLVDFEISLGDFVLTGGEIPAMAMIDATIRLLPGVINSESLKNETHSQPKYKQFPQYTRPEIFNAKSKKLPPLSVPGELLSGNHAKIKSWRKI